MGISKADNANIVKAHPELFALGLMAGSHLAGSGWNPAEKKQDRELAQAVKNLRKKLAPRGVTVHIAGEGDAWQLPKRTMHYEIGSRRVVVPKNAKSALLLHELGHATMTGKGALSKFRTGLLRIPRATGPVGPLALIGVPFAAHAMGMDPAVAGATAMGLLHVPILFEEAAANVAGGKAAYETGGGAGVKRFLKRIARPQSTYLLSAAALTLLGYGIGKMLAEDRAAKKRAT